MSHSTISLGLGLGGGKAATSSGAPSGGGGTPFANTLSGLFDGGDNMDISSITLSGAKAVSLWVKVGTKIASGSGATLVAGANDYFPYIAYGRYLYARGTNNAGTAGNVQYVDCGSGFFTSGDWFHVCISSDGTTITYYVNGSSKGTDINVDPQSLVFIGGRPSFMHDSNLDEVALWDSELSAAQVTNIYRGEEDGGSGGTNGTPGDLSSFSPLHWWRFGDGTGDVNASGGTPANTGAIGTLVDQGSGGKNATQTTASEQPTFSNVLPA